MNALTTCFLILTTILLSCVQSTKLTENDELALVLIEHYEFRRNYFGQEDLTGDSLTTFMTRSPQLSQDFEKTEHNKFSTELKNKGFITDETLNLSFFNEELYEFTYHHSTERSLNLKVAFLPYKKGENEPAYLLTFEEDNTTILSDTLNFKFPPDVTFKVADLNDDGKDEILALHQYYMINGDNFDLQVFEVISN